MSAQHAHTHDDPFVSPTMMADNWDLGTVLNDIWASAGAASTPVFSTRWPWFPSSEGSPHYTHRSTPTHDDYQPSAFLQLTENPAAAPSETMYMSSSYGSPVMHGTSNHSSPGGRVLSFSDRPYETSDFLSRSPVSSCSGGDSKPNIHALDWETKSPDRSTELRERRKKQQQQTTKREEVIVKVYDKVEKAKKFENEEHMKAVRAAWSSLREKEESVTKRVMARKRRIRRLKEDAYWAAQVYALLQGVLYAAVAASEKLTCDHMRFVGALALTITVSTAFVVVNRLSTAERDLPLADRGEDYRRYLVNAVNNLLHQPIDDVFSGLPANPYLEVDQDTPSCCSCYQLLLLRLPTSGFFYLFLLFLFSFIIIVSCTYMLCNNCTCDNGS